MGQIYAGTSGWAYKSWSPDFYPKSLKASDYLSFYSSRLNAVEVNYTFRHRLSEKVQEQWLHATPPDFVFSVKAPQVITHFKRLRDCSGLLGGFLESLQPLLSAGRLGPLLFQLPPNMKADTALFREFIQHVPRAARPAFEFRHASWFDEPVFDLLREFNAALCVAETEDLSTPDLATADFYYSRLRKPDYSESELGAISAKAQQYSEGGDVFLFFKHEETPEGAMNAIEVLGRLRKKAA